MKFGPVFFALIHVLNALRIRVEKGLEGVQGKLSSAESMADFLHSMTNLRQLAGMMDPDNTTSLLPLLKYYNEYGCLDERMFNARRIDRILVTSRVKPEDSILRKILVNGRCLANWPGLWKLPKWQLEEWFLDEKEEKQFPENPLLYFDGVEGLDIRRAPAVWEFLLERARRDYEHAGIDYSLVLTKLIGNLTPIPMIESNDFHQLLSIDVISGCFEKRGNDVGCINLISQKLPKTFTGNGSVDLLHRAIKLIYILERFPFTHYWWNQAQVKTEIAKTLVHNLRLIGKAACNQRSKTPAEVRFDIFTCEFLRPGNLAPIVAPSLKRISEKDPRVDRPFRRLLAWYHRRAEESERERKPLKKFTDLWKKLKVKATSGESDLSADLALLMIDLLRLMQLKNRIDFFKSRQNEFREMLKTKAVDRPNLLLPYFVQDSQLNEPIDLQQQLFSEFIELNYTERKHWFLELFCQSLMQTSLHQVCLQDGIPFAKRKGEFHRLLRATKTTEIFFRNHFWIDPLALSFGDLSAFNNGLTSLIQRHILTFPTKIYQSIISPSVQESVPVDRILRSLWNRLGNEISGFFIRDDDDDEDVKNSLVSLMPRAWIHPVVWVAIARILVLAVNYHVKLPGWRISRTYFTQIYNHQTYKDSTIDADVKRHSASDNPRPDYFLDVDLGSEISSTPSDLTVIDKIVDRTIKDCQTENSCLSKTPVHRFLLSINKNMNLTAQAFAPREGLHHYVRYPGMLTSSLKGQDPLDSYHDLSSFTAHLKALNCRGGKKKFLVTVKNVVSEGGKYFWWGLEPMRRYFSAEEAYNLLFKTK